jgi:hypothetical protein
MHYFATTSVLSNQTLQFSRHQNLIAAFVKEASFKTSLSPLAGMFFFYSHLFFSIGSFRAKTFVVFGFFLLIKVNQLKK